MSKISGWNFSQNITSADNCKQKNEFAKKISYSLTASSVSAITNKSRILAKYRFRFYICDIKEILMRKWRNW